MTVNRMSIAVPWLPVGLAIGVVLMGGFLESSARRAELRTNQARHARIDAELRSWNERVAVAIDSTAVQVRLAEHTLAWLEDRESVSSASLVRTLARLGRPHNPQGAAGGMVSDPAAVQDDELRYAVAAVHAALVGSTHEDAEFAAYRALLDIRLAPGVWEIAHGRDPGARTVDYRDMARVLYDGDFEHVVRGVLRALLAQHTRLQTISTHIAAARSLLSTPPEVGP